MLGKISTLIEYRECLDKQQNKSSKERGHLNLQRNSKRMMRIKNDGISIPNIRK